MLNDPFPRQLLLGAKEIRMLLGLDRSAWAELLANPPPDFPPPVAVGQTAAGHDRPRWKKGAVYNWIDSLPRARPAPKPSESVRNRQKRAGAVPAEDDAG